ncbi:MAG: GNAT family N-acetyltransferase, partial [Vicinamibacterales bacterium]
VQPYTVDERRAWFDEHAAAGRHRLMVAIDDDNSIAGYATTSRWRPKAAYDTTVESSVYCRHDLRGRGVGRLLYQSLFAAIAAEDVYMIVAGATIPNDASVALHERMGFARIGVFTGVGRKFDRFWDVAWFQRPLAR